MNRHSALVLLAASVALTACQDSTPTPPASNTAVAINAPMRPVAKAPTAGVGVLLGGWVGTATIATLNDADRLKSQQAENRAYTVAIGQKVTWSNAETGNAGTIVPVRDGYDANGAYFREFQQTLTAGGAQYQGTDKAAQQPDGTWKIVK